MENVSDNRNAAWGRRLPLLVVAAVAIAGAVLLRPYLSFEALSENRFRLMAFRDAHYLLSVLTLSLGYIAIVAFSLPGATVATLTIGFLFGTMPGVAINVVSATTGATIIFLVAKTGVGDALAARMEHSKGAVARLKHGLDENQWSVLFLMRLVPAVPFFVANLVPAMIGVPLYRFVITTFFGIMPGAVVYTSLGAGLGEVFAAGQTPDLGVIFEPHIFWPLIGLSALAALPLFVRWFRGRKAGA